MRPSAQVLRDFVWAPLAEVAVPLLFAFGAEWALMCEQLGLKQEPDGDQEAKISAVR